jgi:arylsulfatase A-like enzyme
MNTPRALPGLLLAIFLVSCESAPAPSPNVIMIVVDDLGWMDTGVYGSSFYETPNIDRLASEGVRFSQFYTASPVCSPTRASLMTGKHPARLHITNWIGGEQNGLLDQAEYERQLPLKELTIGEAFEEQGYTTGYIGKWHLGRDGFLPDSQGFGFTFAVNEAGQPGSYFPPYENPNWPLTNVPGLGGDGADAYLTDRLTDVALDFIASNQASPFLLVLSHYAVHTPLQAPAGTVERYEEKASALGPESDLYFRPEREAITKLRQDHPTYAAMIEHTDASVGRVLGRLSELGIEENTIVAFVSDNGGLSTLRRRGFSQATSNAPLRAGKGWLYEGGIRAPLIVRWPDAAPAGRVVDAPVMSMDLFPTLLDMAGLPGLPEQHVDGESLVEAMSAGGAEGGSLPLAQVEGGGRPLYWHFPHYHGSGNRPGGAIRVRDFKMLEWFEDGATELYDLSVDPGEEVDLAQDHPAEVTRLKEMLKEWRAQVGAKMPTRSDGSAP